MLKCCYSREKIFVEIKQYGSPEAMSEEFSFKCLSVIIYEQFIVSIVEFIMLSWQPTLSPALAGNRCFLVTFDSASLYKTTCVSNSKCLGYLWHGLGSLDLYLAVSSLTDKMNSYLDPVYMQATAFAVFPSAQRRY